MKLVVRYISRSAVVFGAAVLLVMVASDRAPQRVIEGAVVTLMPNGAFTVSNEQTDSRGVRFVLARETRQEGGVVRSGAHVRVWFRVVGDHQWSADRVLVLD
jgi:hypothetical protein